MDCVARLGLIKDVAMARGWFNPSGNPTKVASRVCLPEGRINHEGLENETDAERAARIGADILRTDTEREAEVDDDKIGLTD